MPGGGAVYGWHYVSVELRHHSSLYYHFLVPLQKWTCRSKSNWAIMNGMLQNRLWNILTWLTIWISSANGIMFLPLLVLRPAVLHYDQSHCSPPLQYLFLQVHLRSLSPSNLPPLQPRGRSRGGALGSQASPFNQDIIQASIDWTASSSTPL